MKKYSSCVIPEGLFVYGIHKPEYRVTNLRCDEQVEDLGLLRNGSAHTNINNFPPGDVEASNTDWIYEIANPLPFKGTTYIGKRWADAAATDPSRIRLPRQDNFSLKKILDDKKIASDLITELPQQLLLTIATCSTDPEELKQLASMSCSLIVDASETVTGLEYLQADDGRVRASIHDHALFEAVANNPALPNDYKRAMVLRPGAQGDSEIVGEWPADDNTHVFEYLRKNSYIAGGHYAANMSDDAVRYGIDSLSGEDMTALRHLYYQRSYVRIAELLGLQRDYSKKMLSTNELEELRLAIATQIANMGVPEDMEHSTLWGWNYGFDYAPSNYRLHASHQQIHQQYAMVPEKVSAYTNGNRHSIGKISAFSSGDMVAEVINDYYDAYSRDFFTDYLRAILNNSRMDDRTDLSSSLIIRQDNHSILFVPKAQTSQWELQLMTTPDDAGHFPGNIMETGPSCRESLDTALLTAQQVLARLGAKMVTTIEYSKRISGVKTINQPLLYCFLPKLPQSPGAFSEAQLRFINGHYPEDFAAACRDCL